MATKEQIYTAIRNANAAGDADSVKKLAAYLKAMPVARDPNEIDPNTGKTRAELEQNLVTQQAKSARMGADIEAKAGGEAIGHQIGMTSRDVAVGGLHGPAFLADVAGLAGSPLAALGRKMRGEPVMPAGAAVDAFDKRFLDKPINRPQGAGEQIRSDMTRAASGALMTAGAGGATSLIKNPIAGTAVGNYIAANPISQAASAATGAGAAGVTREAGGGEVAQTVAGLAGAMGPGVIKHGVQRSLNKTYNPKPDASTAHAAEFLKKAGVDVDAAQASGSAKLKDIKASLSDNPFTAPKQVENYKKQMQQYASAGLKVAGQKAELATPEVMGNALDKVGGKIGKITARTPVKYSTALHNEIEDVLASAERTVPASDVEMLRKQVQFLQKNIQSSSRGAMIPGETLGGAHSELGRIASGGGAAGHAAGELKSVLDDAVQNAATPLDAARLKKARTQYRAILQLGKAVDHEGYITPQKLETAIKSDAFGKKQYFYNRGDQALANLARAGQKILPDRMPNSGTTKRVTMQALPTAALAAATGLATGNVLPAVGVASSYYALPKFRQSMLTNPPKSPGPYRPPANALAGLLGNQDWAE